MVVENFPLVSGELTREGFITLHTMEAEDNGGDERELRVTLQTMGSVLGGKWRNVVFKSFNPGTIPSLSRTSPPASC